MMSVFELERMLRQQGKMGEQVSRNIYTLSHSVWKSREKISPGCVTAESGIEQISSLFEYE